MPETPDFEQLAERIAPPPSTMEAALHRTLVGMIEEHLLMIWNARGAADVAQLEAVRNADSSEEGWRTCGEALEQIRALDR